MQHVNQQEPTRWTVLDGSAGIKQVLLPIGDGSGAGGFTMSTDRAPRP